MTKTETEAEFKARLDRLAKSRYPEANRFKIIRTATHKASIKNVTKWDLRLFPQLDGVKFTATLQDHFSDEVVELRWTGTRKSLIAFIQERYQ
jgi:hypothetical protein